MAKTAYFLGVLALSGVSLLMALLIIFGEMKNDYAIGVGAAGLILMAYGVMVLLLRKLGLIGPRGAEGR